MTEEEVNEVLDEMSQDLGETSIQNNTQNTQEEAQNTENNSQDDNAEVENYMGAEIHHTEGLIDAMSHLYTIQPEPITASQIEINPITMMNNVEAPNEVDDIPTNSPTLQIDESTSRFSSAIWYNKIREKTITLAGLGGIGSYVGFMLARMHPYKLILYDDDNVELGNMSGQLYSYRDAGNPKVSSLCSILGDFANYYSVTGLNEKFTSSTKATDIMICGFDSMHARKSFYYSWMNHITEIPKEERKNCLFIDGRLAAEEFQVFCMQGDDERAIKLYRDKWLFSDEEADATICSYKQTTFCANMIGSVIVNLFTNFVANQCEPLIDRDLPFITEYNASTMYFKTIS